MPSLRLTVILLLLAQSADAADTPDNKAGIRFFESKIRPILVKHCYECHSTQSGTSEGGLRLDSRKSVRTGGDRGPAIALGAPEKSLLITVVSHSDPDLKMPPGKRRLPDTAIADLRRWIKMGAPDSRDEPTSGAIKRAGQDFWAYQTPTKPNVPKVNDSEWPRQALDHFVIRKLNADQIAPSADADPSTLLRRLHFDLVGLPPSPATHNKFVRHLKTKGVESALRSESDKLLASPQFGERWGRHWLDVARFAESSGKDANISFPYAWRYRDYVIDCINADIPFDRFLVEQLAGDLLPYESPKERARLLIATGFLAIGTKNLSEMNPYQFLADIVDEQIDTTTRAVMASSIACSRCHEHKFDPFTMRDYYALAGIFTSTKTCFGTAVSPANRVGGDPLPLPVAAELQVCHRSLSAKRVKKLKAEMASLRKEEREGRAAVRKAIAAGKDPSGLFTLRDALRVFWRTGAIEGQLE